MIHLTLVGVIMMISPAYFGQILSDESSSLYDQLNECDWIHWSQSNRRNLLIILPAIVKPTTLSFFGLMDLDLRLLLFVYISNGLYLKKLNYNFFRCTEVFTPSPPL
ncbi:hypothetical protein JTB14_034982 [Gonioctena quinquepunctata]|nr:hypothetical protein JTB14_034982 [Gonioctena quinquepunctata]